MLYSYKTQSEAYDAKFPEQFVERIQDKPLRMYPAAQVTHFPVKS